MRSKRTKWIKKKAHTFTWAAIWWLIFSVPACSGFATHRLETRLISAAALIIEVLLIAFAVGCWIREEKQEVSWETD